MAPKNLFTREDILAAGLKIVRQEGMAALTARSLAAKLGCSVKPIFGLFENMEQVQQGVIGLAHQRYQACLRSAVESGEFPVYKATGMGYIRFAREEKQLFGLLFMRDRTGENIREDQEEIQPILELLMNKLGLSREDAYLFHLEQWVYVHGIATMIATNYLDWDMDFVSRALTDVYRGLCYRYTGKGEINGSH